MAHIPDLAPLKELNQRLTYLLDDPQPGLVMWQAALYRVLEEIAVMFPSTAWNPRITGKG